MLNPKLLIVVLIFFPIFSKKLALKTILLTSLKTEKGIVLSGNYQLKFKPCKKRRNESGITPASGTGQRSLHMFRGDLFSGTVSVIFIEFLV